MSELSKPKLTPVAGGLRLDWEPEHLHIAVDRLNENKDGRVTGEIIITTSAEGFCPHLLSDHFNFSSARSRKVLAQQLTESYNHVDWQGILEQLSIYTIRHLRQERPIIQLTSYENSTPPAFDLFPFLLKGEPNLIYGEGGSGKSFIALLLTIIVELGWTNNPYDFEVKEAKRVLYLDYERSIRTLSWRMNTLHRGFKQVNNLQDIAPLYYQRCHVPFAQDIRNITNWVAEAKADIIIVDSLGVACGGDMNESEPAIKFFGALGSLCVTSLLISHVSKDQLTKRKTPFGSAYFWNESSSIWEVKGRSDWNTGFNTITLTHRKANDFRLHAPIGLRQTFNDRTTSFELCEPQIEGNTKNPDNSNYHRIWQALDKPMKLDTLQAKTGIPKDTLSPTLNRMAQKGYVFNVKRGMWERGKPLEDGDNQDS